MLAIVTTWALVATVLVVLLIMLALFQTKMIKDKNRQILAAVRAVRYIRMTNREFEQLAKTGCTHCHGTGMKGTVKEPNVCTCVLKRIAGHANYAAFPDGTIGRLATDMELDALLPTERTDDVIPIQRARR